MSSALKNYLIDLKVHKKFKKYCKKLLTNMIDNGIIICRIKMALLSVQFFRKKKECRHHSETYMKERCFSCLQSLKPAESSTR